MKNNLIIVRNFSFCYSRRFPSVRRDFTMLHSERILPTLETYRIRTRDLDPAVGFLTWLILVALALLSATAWSRYLTTTASSSRGLLSPTLLHTSCQYKSGGGGRKNMVIGTKKN